VNAMEKARKRSEGRCEAMIRLNDDDVWTRCWGGPVDIHHMLTKARGGRVLDDAGEDYHLIACCRVCHNGAHNSNGLEIDGYVITGADGSPVYSGTDEYLTAKYGLRHSGTNTDERTEEAP